MCFFLPGILQNLMIVWRQIICHSQNIFVRKLLKLFEKFVRISLESDVSINNDHVIKVQKQFVIKWKQVKDGVVVLVWIGYLKNNCLS